MIFDNFIFGYKTFWFDLEKGDLAKKSPAEEVTQRKRRKFGFVIIDQSGYEQTTLIIILFLLRYYLYYNNNNSINFNQTKATYENITKGEKRWIRRRSRMEGEDSIVPMLL